MKKITLLLLGVSLAIPTIAKTKLEIENDPRYQSKPASDSTLTLNKAVLESLPFKTDNKDFTHAEKGLIKRSASVKIPSSTDSNVTVWDLTDYQKFIDADLKVYPINSRNIPSTVNPSLWRNALLNMKHGLYKVNIDDQWAAATDIAKTGDIYQVRGYDLSNITFVKGLSGWIVFDPLISPETAAAALTLINTEVETLPVSAIIYSHSHVDHYGGAKGLLTPEQIKNNSVHIVAPEGFTEHAVSENVIAGNAMGRRAVYMYGSLLARDEKGSVSGGLGMTTSTGVAGLLLPTLFVVPKGTNSGNAKVAANIIEADTDTDKIDGITMNFQLTPGTEAPAEMNTWFPDTNALWMAENTTNTLHNVLTLRGAEVRDPLKWSKFLTQTIENWGSKVSVKFQSHHWPLWENTAINDYFEKQRDIYKFTHDQSVRLMNHGYTGEEISEQITLPASLENNWPTRGYYGTLRHNSRAVYQRYMGWYDGHPSDLNNLPPVDVATRYIDFMGGLEEVLKKAKKSYRDGDYRWVAEVMKHAVFYKQATTKNAEADDLLIASKLLLADTLEQLGYQAESGPWRSIYLQGALELRQGKPQGGALETATPDTIVAMTPEMLFDYLAIRLNADKANAKDYTVNVTFTQMGDEKNETEEYTLTIKNSVLNYSSEGRLANNPDLSLSMTKQALNDIQLNHDLTLIQSINNEGGVEMTSDNPAKAQVIIKDIVSMFDDFDFWFNIVTP